MSEELNSESEISSSSDSELCERKIIDDHPGDLKKFDISQETVEKLNTRNIQYLFPVQYQTFSQIMEGKDLIAQAKTGTGKTLAFVIPIIEKLQASKKIKKLKSGRKPSVIVLTPTRELSEQIYGDFNSIISSKLKVTSVYGGVPYEKQECAFQDGVDIVVGTTGRIKDLIDRDVMSLSNIRFVVLDEVDMMLDMGFRDDVELILGSLYGRSNGSAGDLSDSTAAANNLLSANSADWNNLDGEKVKKGKIRSKFPQTLLFSATISDWVKDIAKKYLRSGADDLYQVHIAEDEENLTANSIEHLAILCPWQERSKAIADVIRVYGSGPESRTIIFCDRKKDADELAAHSSMSSECHVYHGDITQDKRTLVIQKFRSGKYRILITTNVGSRGLDIPSVDLVIQCKPPTDVEDYIHRSGRTARAGKAGVCITFYTMNEREKIKAIEQSVGIKFRRVNCPTIEDIALSSQKESLIQFQSIAENAWKVFSPIAQELISTLGSERALCCALAKIAGKTEETSTRSLLTTREGFTSYLLSIKSDEEIRSKSYVYRALQRLLPINITESISHLMFVQGRKAFVFDLPSQHDEEVKSTWSDGKYDKLELLTSIPELEEQDRVDGNNGFFGRGGNSNFSRRRGVSDRGRGGGDRGGRGFSGGQKNFQNNQNFNSNRGGNRGGRLNSNNFRGAGVKRGFTGRGGSESFQNKRQKLSEV